MSDGKESVPESIVAQVAAHERDIANLTGAVQSLSDTLQQTADAQWRAIREQGESLRAAITEQGAEVRKDINVLADKFSESRSVNWPFIVSVIVAGLGVTSLAVTVMTIIGSMVLSPIRDQLADHMDDGHPYRVEKQVIELRAQTGERFGEIETQFQALQTRNNLMHQQNYILLNATRREAGLEPLDFPDFWPVLGNHRNFQSGGNGAAGQ